MDINEVVSSSQQMLYLDCLKQLYKHKNQQKYQFTKTTFQRIINKTSQKVNKIQIENYQQQKDQSKTQDIFVKDLIFKTCVKKVLTKIYQSTTNQQVIQQISYLRLIFFQDILSVSCQLHQKNAQKQQTIYFQVSTYLIKNKIKQIIADQNRKQSVKISIDPVINLQKTTQKMWQILENDLTIKSLKWKKLYSRFCKSRQILQDIFIEVQNLKNFDQIYQKNKQDYKTCNQFLFLSIFYYGSVVFLTKRSEEIMKNILKNLLPLSKIHKRNDKQKLLNSTYSDKFCFIELKITENLDQKLNLTIQRCDRKVTKVFKCKDRSNFHGSGLTKLFPHFIAKQMEQIIIEQIKKNNGKIMNMNLVDFEGKVFQAMVSFKIVYSEEQLSCFMVISQKYKDNLILIDSQGFIEAVGQKYISLFTSNDYRNIHLSTLFSNPRKYQSFHDNFLKRQEQNSKTLLFINIRNNKKVWTDQIHKIKNWMRSQNMANQKTVEISHIRNDEMMRKNQRIFNLNEYFEFIQNLRNQKSRQSAKNLTSQTSCLQTRQGKIQELDLKDFLQVVLKSKKYKIKDKQFYALDLISVQELSHYQRQLVEKIIYQYGKVDNKDKDANCREYNPYKSTLQCFKNQYQQFNEQRNNNLSIKESLSSQQSFLRDIKQRNCQKKQVGENISQSKILKKDIINWSQKLLQNPKLMFDLRLFKFSAISCLLSILVILTVLIGYMFLAQYLYEQQEILQIDCTVSDTFKLTELLYNTAITYHIFKIDKQQNLITSKSTTVSTSLQQIRWSYQQQKVSLLKIITEHQANYQQKLTNVNKIHYYEYLKRQLQWKIIDWQEFNNKNIVNVIQDKQQSSQDKEITIKTSEMLMLYYSYTESILSDQSVSNYVESSPISRSTNSIQTQKSLQLIAQNFPQLKRLNHFNVQYYSQLVNKTYQEINLLIIILITLHVVVSLTVLILIQIQKNFRHHQIFQIVQLYTYIPDFNILKISIYFGSLAYQTKQIIEGNKSKSHKQSSIQDHKIHHFLKNILIKQKQSSSSIINSNQIYNSQIVKESESVSSKRQSSFFNTKKIVDTNDRDLTVLKILFFVVLINFFFIFGLYRLYIINNTLEEVILGIGQLMDAQTYLLESYFDLKANFVSSNTRFDQEFFDEILKNQQSVDVVFNKVAFQSLKIFSKYDPQFQQQLIDLLATDICQIIKEELNEIEYKQCIDTSKMQYFQNGIVVTINYLTRKIYQTILQSQKIASQSNDGSQQKLIFQILREKQHWEIDQNLFYIFRMFQLLQRIVITELKTVIQITLQQCQFLILPEIFIVFFLFPSWILYNYLKQKRTITKLYLSLIFLNQQIIGQSQRIVQKAMKLLEFQQDLI